MDGFRLFVGEAGLVAEATGASVCALARAEAPRLCEVGQGGDFAYLMQGERGGLEYFAEALPAASVMFRARGFIALTEACWPAGSADRHIGFYTTGRLTTPARR